KCRSPPPERRRDTTHSSSRTPSSRRTSAAWSRPNSARASRTSMRAHPPGAAIGILVQWLQGPLHRCRQRQEEVHGGGFEPPLAAWKAEVIPLDQPCVAPRTE